MIRTTASQRGFTLVEVLIAVVIFGVGLLAVASLQGVARKSSYEAVQRTTAVHMADSLLERMRANPQALESYLGSVAQRVLTEAAPPAVATGCNAVWPNTGCGPAALAAVDMSQWWNLVVGTTEVVDGQPVGGLVQPTVCIRGESDGATGAYEVAIAWRCTTEIDQTGADACAAALGYGDFRRVVVVSSYLNAL
jgi:type IV pilus assembly protein PilV